MSESEGARQPKQVEQAQETARAEASEFASARGGTTDMERRYSTCDEEVAQGRKAPTTLVTFRKGRIEVSDPEEFEHGKVCGQAAMIDGGEPAKEKELFRLFEDGVRDIELSESWLVGFFLGMADALLHGRKTFPLEMSRPEIVMM